MVLKHVFSVSALSMCCVKKDEGGTPSFKTIIKTKIDCNSSFYKNPPPLTRPQVAPTFCNSDPMSGEGKTLLFLCRDSPFFVTPCILINIQNILFLCLNPPPPSQPLKLRICYVFTLFNFTIL